MKRVVSLLLFVLIIVGSLTVPAAAATEASGTWGDLEWTLDAEGILTISGEGDMDGLYDSVDAWRQYDNDIKTVVINDSVTSIGDWAFSGCTSLTSITIPDSVTSIGESSFEYCTSLTSITIPNSVTRIENWAFVNCTSLTSVTIPNSVTRIGWYVFSSCTSLTSITIPDSVTSIGRLAFYNTGYYNDESNWENGALYIDNCLIKVDSNFEGEFTFKTGTKLIADYAFENCTSLTSLTIPDSVTSIVYGAFRGCTSLTSITIPDSVTSIDESAFEGYTSLTSITIPDSVTSIGRLAFYNTGYYNDESNWENGALYIDNCLIEVSSDFEGEFTFKTGTKLIADYAFENCTSLTSITIPNSVTSIGDKAFFGCTSLTSITIPDSVTSIGDFAFNNCTSLTNITIPDSVTSIGWSAFGYCTSLTSITIPDSVTHIGAGAFYNCTSLTSITIPDSVTYIDQEAFSGCTSLTSITIPNSVTSIGWYVFSDCTSLTSITIPDSVTSVDENAFFGCTSLTSIKVDVENANYCDIDGVLYDKDKTSIELYPAGKTNTSYTIPNSVTSIGWGAFRGCTSLTSITIPGSVTSIDSGAFRGCTSLKCIKVDVENANYCDIDGVLYDKDKTTIIQYPTGKTDTAYTIPDGVTSVGESAFYECTSLTSITIPDGVTHIGVYAFRGCTSLTSITIPDSVISIDYSAFYGCTSLTSITIPDGVTSISESAFEYCTSLTSITIPSSVTSIGDWAFYSCASLETVYYGGTEEEWQQISIADYNYPLKNANIVYNYVPFGGASGEWDNLDWVLDTEGTLTISGTGAMEAFGATEQQAMGTKALGLIPYASSNAGWLEYKEHIVKVIIEDGVTSISDGAFANCENLINIRIPETVTQISSTAFENTTSLASIDYVGTKDEWANIGGNDAIANPDVELKLYYIKGDVNGDGEVDNLDAATILKYDAGILENIIETIADVNNDGVADNLDAAMILKYDAGIIDSL